MGVKLSAGGMSSSSSSTVELKLPFLVRVPSPADVHELAEYAQCAAVLYGLVMALETSSGTECNQVQTWTAVPVPMTLFPTVIPRACYHQARSLVATLHRCIDGLARDTPFLLQSLHSTASQDDFTARLCDLVRQQPLKADVPALSVTRADYFVTANGRLQLVEINTIASSFGALGSRLRALHTHVLHRADILGLASELRHGSHSDGSGQFDGAMAQLASWRRGQCENNMPESGALEGIAEALAHAHRWWRAQHERYSSPVGSTVMLFVVQPKERNIYDQKWIELTLWKEHNIRVRRATLTEIAQNGQLVGGAEGSRPTLQLRSTSNAETEQAFISVVYYRAGYVPQDYASDREWQARAMIARSNAVECPNASYQLVGTKRMQQILGEPGVLERYLDDTRGSERMTHGHAAASTIRPSHPKAEALRETFVGMYAFDDPSTRAALVQRVLDQPENYVLKPQREGGGHNLYGAEMKTFIERTWNAPDMLAHRQDPDHPLCAYVLMDRIHPGVSPNVILRNGHTPVQSDCVSELGIFGIFFGSTENAGSPGSIGVIETLNQAVGHLLRTKLARQDDGGVAAGVAALDSPWLDTA